VDFQQGEFTKADAEIEAARASLDPDGEPLDEQAALADLAARASARHGQGDAAIKGLQEAVDLDRRSLAEAQRKALPLGRRMIALATNLARLGNEMRHEGFSEAGQICDEAEQLATEVLKTYPNQLSTRSIIDLIRHSDRLIEKSWISHTNPTSPIRGWKSSFCDFLRGISN
jgi:tetratricopeptide (TPR) repeat protein